ncbi:hypothetical protein [Neolewinella litorea]|uniref:Bacterial Pleckstrin homology domain-containing protein n=1 Tax=Neolewinella litorea TaxID=2562452 RepID=A0A4S4NMJ3_9BACT|nr:hypothetical protein [Neolewinella litorea]THH41146.1 hypothetical protein E4021_00690 [Neolewinella litorea]
METVLFAERQKFNAWWVSVLNIFLFALSLYTYYRLWSIGAGWSGYLAPTGIMLVVIATASVTLRTRITDQTIEAGFSPFLRRRYSRAEVVSAYVRTYDPLLEFGGWGWRFGANGTAFNTMGNQGLQLHLRDGSRLLIGTQQPTLLEQVVKDWMGADAGTVTLPQGPG